jgi:hypothetical protein
MQEPQLANEFAKKHKHKKSFPFLVRDDTGSIRKNTGDESGSSSVEIASPIRSENVNPPSVTLTLTPRSLIEPAGLPSLSSTILPAENEHTSRSSRKHKQSSNLQILNNSFPTLSEDVNYQSGPTLKIGNDIHRSLTETSFVSSEVTEKNAIQAKKRRGKSVQSQSTLLVSRFTACVAKSFDLVQTTTELSSNFLEALAHPQAQCSILFAPTEVTNDSKLLSALSQHVSSSNGAVIGEDARYRLEPVPCRPARYLVVARDSEADSWKTLTPRIDTALLLTRAPNSRRIRSPGKWHRAHGSCPRASLGDAVASAAEQTEAAEASSSRSVTGVSVVSRASSGVSSAASSALRSSLSDARAAKMSSANRKLL